LSKDCTDKVCALKVARKRQSLRAGDEFCEGTVRHFVDLYKEETDGRNPLGNFTKFRGSLDLGKAQGSYNAGGERFKAQGKAER
jgi:hypothetical protein